ncbi:transcriptional regulator [Paenibacillus luteus]|uniref:transcriptional regulator n=1 Tax=Paenibacillus luteus TaxID=2545753 RepID=UPI001F4FBD21|nr:transcriptional regulator [Paenibacillus luteus]
MNKQQEAASADSLLTLRGELELTEGNLGNHISVLEEAAYIKVTKTFADKRPTTICSTTPLGLEMFEQYISGLEKIICMARATGKKAKKK